MDVHLADTRRRSFDRRFSQAILHRKGRSERWAGSCGGDSVAAMSADHSNMISIDDIYTKASAKGERYFTMHVTSSVT